MNMFCLLDAVAFAVDGREATLPTSKAIGSNVARLCLKRFQGSHSSKMSVYMGLLLGIFLMQVFPSAAHVSHTVTIDSDHTLLLIGGRKINDPAMGEYGTNIVGLASGESLRLEILEKSGRTWELGDPSVGLGGLFSVRVARLDRSSLVIERNVASDYGSSSPSLKFFFDLTRRRVLKTIVLDNPPPSVVRIQPVENRMCASVKTSERAFVSCGDEVAQTIVAQLGPPANLPDPVAHPVSDSRPSPIPEPLPQSSYDQFAQARPQRVRDGYSRGSTIKERIGAHQVLRERIWFGKAFYDGEGTTGVGGLGYFDTRTKQFTMFSIPELVDWSVSALLVEDDDVWAGLVNYPEGAGRSGGLIRYDLSTHKVIQYDVPDIVLTMIRQDNALFMGTSNGLYILRDGRMTRFRFERGLDSNIAAVRDPLP
jgi:hypothetical protein